jgi:hypothetical protein
MVLACAAARLEMNDIDTAIPTIAMQAFTTKRSTRNAQLSTRNRKFLH